MRPRSWVAGVVLCLSAVLTAQGRDVFEVATIKPSDPEMPSVLKLFTVRGREVLAVNTTAADMIAFAYGVQKKQVSGGPAWLDTDRLDVTGRPQADGVPNNDQLRALFKSLLADRFRLTVHVEKRDLPAYALLVGNRGPKLTPNTSNPDGLASTVRRAFGELAGTNAGMSHLAGLLQTAVLDRPVVDRTGLRGRFDFTLRWTPDPLPGAPPGPPPPPDPNPPPGFFTAIQEQLGLRVEPQTAAVDVVVIDRIERPSAN